VMKAKEGSAMRALADSTREESPFYYPYLAAFGSVIAETY